LRPLETLAYTAGTLQSAVARGRRVFEVLDEVAEVKDQVGALDLAGRARGEIEFENVSFAYREGQSVLCNVDLKIEAGETIAIVGPSGAGKTTMASLLMRFYDVKSGRIRIDRRDVRAVTLRWLRKNVALVMQEAVLFGGTIRENIAYGREGASVEEIEEAAGASGAHEFISALPQGYETKIGERGVTLSGGQRQRVAIARAFLKDAPILVMDEPTSALDSQSEADLLEAMERLGRGRTTIIIAHRLSTIRNADRIVVMNEGKIIEVGTHEELLARDGLYSSLHQAQFGTSAEAM
jgi:ABC-type multidrug transport system fused ATPase/permease subunit